MLGWAYLRRRPRSALSTSKASGSGAASAPPIPGQFRLAFLKRGEPDRASAIPLTNFRGIELRDFPAEIARLALIIAEFQCDVLYRGPRLALLEFLPLDAQNWIVCGNALRLDWLSICPPTGTGVKLNGDDLFNTPLEQAEIDFTNEGGETYICGNPPYVGDKKQSEGQKE